MHNPKPQDLEGKLEELTDKVDEVASTIKTLEEEKKDKHEKMIGFHPLILDLLFAFKVVVGDQYLSVTATQNGAEGAQVVRARKY